jgi:CheY-like chemotaxis protein
MGLQCLIVTSDPGLLGPFKASLNEHQASLDMRQDSASATELAFRRHWDGVVIDCDDVPGGRELIAQVRQSRSNKQTLIFAVVNGSTSTDTVLDLGASFVLSKPLQESRLRSVLDLAVPKMEREHRRYFRYDADLPLRISNHDGQAFRALMQNVSEGGLAVKPIDPLTLEGVVNVEFDLPSVDPQVFHARADVVWREAFVIGLRFLHVEKDSRAALEAWLSSLEARAQFRHSFPPIS